MSGRLFVITGASGSGKTQLLNNLRDAKPEIVLAPKYSSRPRRSDSDDVFHADDIEIGKYNVVYDLNNEKYGLIFSEIENDLAKGKSVFIVLSYLRVVRDLKERFGSQVTIIYVSSAIDPAELRRIQLERNKGSFEPKADQINKLESQFKRLQSAIRLSRWPSLLECMAELNEDWKNVLPQADSTEIRVSKIRDFHKTYVDNIHLFDHVILNYKIDKGGVLGVDMLRQAIHILEFYGAGGAKRLIADRPVLFVVAAASGTGKGILMETLNTSIGPDRIRVLAKEAKRDSKDNDKRDGMKAIGKDGAFDPEFDFTWFFHKDGDFEGTEYAISSAEIEKNIQAKKPQIVVSNMGVFDQFREKYGGRVVFLYLHALRTRDQVEKYQYKNNKSTEEAEVRIAEIDKVYDTYIDRISEFDHVLLNTAYPEDLYEQVFTLIADYGTKYE